MPFDPRKLYIPLWRSDSSEGVYSNVCLEEEKSQDGVHPHQCCHNPRGPRQASRFRLDLFALLAATLSALIFIAVTLSRQPSDATCARQLSSYSPAIEAVEYYDTEFGKPSGNKSPYRGPPTPEREKLWTDLWSVEAVLLPPEDLIKLNRTEDAMDNYIKAEPEYGDGYLAYLEVYHKLHCLDILRQYSWWLMGKYPEDLVPAYLRAGGKGDRMHVDHCIEVLRIGLMCEADVTPLLSVRDPGGPTGRKADSNARHRCRNFARVQEWTRAHRAESLGAMKQAF